MKEKPLPPTHVYLLRHAQCEKNDCINGFESDVPLSKLGQKQALAIGEIMVKYDAVAVISSGMLRAKQTAEEIAIACQIDHYIEPLLHERKVGRFSGTPVNHEDPVWVETVEKWKAGQTEYAPEGVESFADISRRVLPVWDEITTRFAGEKIIVVAHGIVIKVLLLNILAGYNASDWHRLGRIENVGITEIIGTGRNWQAKRISEIPQKIKELGT
jgi:broad specificity phosphatase PhoE